MAVVSKLVGHSSIEITSKVYAHLYPQTMNSAVERLSELLAQEESNFDNVHKNKKRLGHPSRFVQMVGTMRFELMTPSTPRKCATKLRYVPSAYIIG